MNNGFNFYRIKTEWLGENEEGGASKIKSEELAYLSSYTEAEALAYELADINNRTDIDANIDVSITKTKIVDVLFNDTACTDQELVKKLVYNYFEEGDETGIGLYAVKVEYFEIDEKTGKKSKKNDTIYTPAISNVDAINRTTTYLKDIETRDFVVREAKFDKAEAILWDTETHKKKTMVK